MRSCSDIVTVAELVPHRKNAEKDRLVPYIKKYLKKIKKKLKKKINSGIVFNNDVSEIIAFRHMVVSLAVLNHILRENTMTRKHCHNQLGS